ncbi:MAG: hypothetical protein JWP27_1356 [Flaviaesturariibacter sp.]|nr:hypothetical protein [Flaviaesturariibacter sp.]
MRPILFTLCLILSNLAGRAQEEFISPARFLTRFDFHQFTGGLIVLQAQLGVFPDTLNFVLDTGSGGISLDSMTTEYFGLTPTPTDRMIRGIAGQKKVSFLYNQRLSFPYLTIDSLNFHVADYSLLTAVYGEKIDGIIGYSILSRYIIKINYDSSFVEFWTKGSMKYPRGGYLLRPNIASLPVQTLRVRDNETVNARFLYDMGAGLNMMLTTDFVRDSSLLGRKRKLYAKEGEGLGGKIDMHITVIKEVKLGPYRFRNVPTYIFDDSYNVTSYPYLGGLIGSDLLRRFNIILNYDRRDIHLIPNKHYNDGFDYAYSGIELYGINGEIIVGDVAKDSPAQACGVKEGDVVIAIDKNFVQDLQRMKAALQMPGNKVTMIVRRGTELIELSLRVKSIL